MSQNEKSELLLAKQRAESLKSQLDTGASLRLMAEGMVTFMTPPGAAGNPQRAEDIIEISGRVTSLAETMKSGFEELQAIMLMQRPPVAIEVSFLFHRIMLKY